MTAINVLSVNVGEPREIFVGQKRVLTGCFKRPSSNSVYVSSAGLDGDLVADTTRHGGRDQAVYLFSAEDRQWWSERLNQTLPPGFFGENLSIDAWWPEPRVGDQIRFEELTLEISFPRIPCATLAARVGDPTFLKAFVAANRPGLYARVLRSGAVAAGSSAVICTAPASFPLTKSLFEAWHQASRDLNLLRAALEAPIAERARTAFLHWLAKA